jgi:hypothetical protein
VEPGEFVGTEGTDAGVQVPEVGINWLDGSWLVRHAPNLPVYGSPVLGGGLQEEVGCIEAAKRDGVVVDTAAVVRYALEDALTEDDSVSIASAFWAPDETGAAMAVVFEGYRTRFVALEDLAPEDVDEDLLETLESLAQEGPGSFVIEDSEWARWALKQRLGEE